MGFSLKRFIKKPLGRGKSLKRGVKSFGKGLKKAGPLGLLGASLLIPGAPAFLGGLAKGGFAAGKNLLLGSQFRGAGGEILGRTGGLLGKGGLLSSLGLGGGGGGGGITSLLGGLKDAVPGGNLGLLGASGLLGSGAQNLLLGKPGRFRQQQTDPNQQFFSQAQRQIGERFLDPSQDPILQREIRGIGSGLGITSQGAKGVLASESLARHSARAGEFIGRGFEATRPITQFEQRGTGLLQALGPFQQFQRGRAAPAGA